MLGQKQLLTISAICLNSHRSTGDGAGDRSALIPILQTRIEGERVSIYRASADDNEDKPASRPMGGMLLKNTSKLTLEDGSLTVIDGDAYAGEALLQRLKPAGGTTGTRLLWISAR